MFKANVEGTRTIMLAAADPGDFDLVIQRIDVLPISREA